jgi:outer membrane protein, heavy metal efflux system
MFAFGEVCQGGILLRLARKVPAYAVLWAALVSLAAAQQASRAASSVPGPPAVSIQDAVAEAIQNNPGLVAERMGIPVAEAALITARLRPNPVVSYSADHLDWLGTGFNDVNGAGPPELALRVDLPWERAHKRELRQDAAGYQKKILQARIAESVRRLTLDVTLACIDVMEARSKLALANDNLHSLEGIVTLNQTRVSGGAIAPVELVRSRVAMLQFRASVKTAALAQLTARTRLQMLVGRRPGDSVIDVAGEMKAPLPAQGPDLARIQQTALQSRPDLQAIQLDQARSQAELRLQIAQGKVDYTFGTEYRRQQGVNGTGNSLGFFFSAPLPMFNRNQGEIARVRAEQEQLRKSFEAQRAQVLGDVMAAWQEFESARTMVAEIERDLIGPSEEARNTTAYVYRAGASSLLDVLDAQRAFNETMSAYYSAQAEYRRAASRLAAAVGQEVNE